MRVDVRTVNRCVTAGGPASAAFHKIPMGDFANHQITGRDVRSLDLDVAFQAKIIVAFDEELAIHGAVRVVAGGATVAQSFVLEDVGLTLFAVTLGAGLVEARHREAAGGLHDVVTMRVVALHAIHHAFNDRMMLGEVKFGVDVEMALKTGGRIFAWIHDETTSSAADADVFAGRAVTGFATGH